MTTSLHGAGTATESLTERIGDCERRLDDRRGAVRARGAALGRTLSKWVTGPAGLLAAGGVGFLIGELTQRGTPEAQGKAPARTAGHALFDTVRNVITLATLARPLFSPLPGARTQPDDPAEAATPAPTPQSGEAPLASVHITHPIA
jgi:hypothetical protein